MDLSKKQLMEKKKVSFIVSIIIVATMLLYSVYKLLTGFAMVDFIRIGVVVVALLFIIFSMLVLKNKDGSEMFANYAAGVAYGVVTLTSINDSYVYAFMYPIVILVLIFQETKKAVLGSAVAVLVNVAFTVMYFIMSDKANIMQVIFQLVFCLLTCFVAIYVINTLSKHNKESMGAIAKSAEAQKGTALEVMGVSEDIADKIDGAQGLVEKLNSAISESNEAVNEIAASMKTTAEILCWMLRECTDFRRPTSIFRRCRQSAI